MGNILATLGLVVYLLVLGRETDRAISQWQMRKVASMIGGLVIFQIVLNAGFFMWTCIVIYQLLFDMQPNTYNQVGQLLFFCIMDIGVEIFIAKNLP